MPRTSRKKLFIFTKQRTSVTPARVSRLPPGSGAARLDARPACPDTPPAAFCLSLLARNEWGESRREGKLIKSASSPRPSPPFSGGEGEKKRLRAQSKSSAEHNWYRNSAPKRSKAGSRFACLACPRTPKLPAPQADVAHLTVLSLALRPILAHLSKIRIKRLCRNLPFPPTDYHGDDAVADQVRDRPAFAHETVDANQK